MNQNEISKLSDQELLEEKKKIKSKKIVNALLIGFFVGVMVYAAAKSGFGFFTFAPLIFVYFIVKNGKHVKAMEDEIKARKL